MEGSFDEKVTWRGPQLVQVLSVATCVADTWTIFLQVFRLDNIFKSPLAVL